MTGTSEPVLFELKELDESFHQKAITCILKTVEISNAPNYPDSVIDWQLQSHYTLKWLNWKMQSAHFIVALIDDLVVGTGMLDGDEVKAVFVDPTYQRKGIGRMIMHELEKFSMHENLGEIHLNSSISGLEFYKSLQYTLIEETVTEFQGDKMITYLMEKRLDV